jgi:aromatic-L-amino-acid/L-tryptophan decarboxylase
MSPPLRISANEMRVHGYRAVDEIVSHLTSLRHRPVGHPPNRPELEAALQRNVPLAGTGLGAVMDQVMQDVFGAIVHTDHPRFLAYVPGPSTFVGALADFLSAGFNVFAGQWLVGSGPAVLERVTVDWLRQMCGLPEGAAGLFLSGGTMANLVAIHAARTRLAGSDRPRWATVYLTDQTHRSIRRGLRFLGFDDAQIRTVPTDDSYRMDPALLCDQVSLDRREGRRPFLVLATAGTTGTGAVDPLAALSRFCADEGLWLHVDAAYGGAAVLSKRGKDLLEGLDAADSVALDLHKWWYQPYEAGCVLVRDATSLTDAFMMDAEYLRETRLGGAPINFYDFGPQLTRSFRALKVWMSINTFGLASFRSAVEQAMALAEHAEAQLARFRWEIVTAAQLAVVTFRPRIAGLSDEEVDALTREIAIGTLKHGYALVTTTEVRGRPVLRLCTIHPETTREDLDATIDVLWRLANRQTTSAALPTLD